MTVNPSDRSDELARRIREARAIPLIRTRQQREALWAAEILIRAGARVIEIALTCPDAPETLRALRASGSDCLVGAASVGDEEDLRRALDAGADFAVSAHALPGLIEYAATRGRPFIPGAATPTEIAAARRSGAGLIKLFPADRLGGPAYLRDLLGPLPGLRLLPAGGISLDEAPAYLEAGAWGVVLGGALVGGDLIRRRAAAALSDAFAGLRNALASFDTGEGEV